LESLATLERATQTNIDNGALAVVEATHALESHREGCLAKAPTREQYIKHIKQDLSIVEQLADRLQQISPNGPQSEVAAAGQAVDAAAQSHAATTQPNPQLQILLHSAASMTTSYELQNLAKMLLHFKDELSESLKKEQAAYTELIESCAAQEKGLNAAVESLTSSVEANKTTLAVVQAKRSELEGLSPVLEKQAQETSVLYEQTLGHTNRRIKTAFALYRNQRNVVEVAHEVQATIQKCALAYKNKIVLEDLSTQP